MMDFWLKDLAKSKPKPPVSANKFDPGKWIAAHAKSLASFKTPAYGNETAQDEEFEFADPSKF